MKKLITIDIGNSVTKIGIFKKNDLLRVEALASSNTDLIHKTLKSILSGGKYTIAIASVVPNLLRNVNEFLKRDLNLTPFVITHESALPIKIEYSTPGTLGIDRICNAAALKCFYDLPGVIVDMGTAITLDVVSQDGTFLGGSILPGPGLMGGALLSRTAQLPKLAMIFPERVIADTTVSNMQSGILFGIVDAIDGLINRIKSELATEDLTVIATGGFAPLITSRTRYISGIHPNITLEGIRLIAEKQNE